MWGAKLDDKFSRYTCNLKVKLYLKSLFFWGEILQPALQLVLITGTIIFILFSFPEGDNNLKSDEVS